MNIFHKVTLQSLKRNKTRTVVTIIGIVLSTALICAVSTSVSSFLDYMKRSIIYENGNWQGSVTDADYDSYSLIKDSDEVSEMVYAQQVGYAEIDSDNREKPFLYILGADKKFADTMSVHIKSGRFPENENEIMLPDHLANNAGLSWSVGDTVELDIGQRTRDGYILGQSNPYYVYDDEGKAIEENEQFTVNETRTFTVVGLFSRLGFEDWFAPGFTAITAPSADDAGTLRYDVYFSMKKPKDIFEFIEKNELEASTNDELLICYGAAKYNGFTDVLYSIAAIIIVLIMFGSISLIYNAFSISVSERTKQFGLLSSAGATRKQLRRSVFFEAGVVSLIGIPIGILVGIAGIGTTFVFIGDKFNSFGGSASGEVKMKLCVSVTAVIIACAVALVTVLISAWIPSKRATKISAVEAIRQTNDIKSQKKHIKTPKIIGKIFGLPGILAHKYYKRSKKKYRATVVSLFMSIVLFIPSAAFTDYLVEMADTTFDTYGYDLSYIPDYEDMSGFSEDEVLRIISNEENTDQAAYCRRCLMTGEFKSEDLTDEIKNIYTNDSDSEIPVYLYFVNDDEFTRLLDENNIKNKDDYMNSEMPLALIYDKVSYFDYKKEKYAKSHILNKDKCSLEIDFRKKFDGYYFETYEYEDAEESEAQAEEYVIYRNNDDPEDSLKIRSDESKIRMNINIGRKIEEAPFFFEYSGSGMIIYPHSAMKKIIPEESDDDFYVSFKLKSEDHAESYTALKELIDNQLLPAGDITDYAEIAESDRNVVTIVQVFAYGFIVLISLIAAANVFNTISTNISLRRREFAMLKSIGMTGGGFNRMMNFECILYGIKSLMYGLPVSIAVTYFIYRSVSEGFETDFRLPWKAIVIAVSSVLLVVFATMMYSMNKIKKDNPIDALKNENL